MDKISAKNLVSECEIELKDQYARLEDIALYNQKKVLDATGVRLEPEVRLWE